MSALLTTLGSWLRGGRQSSHRVQVSAVDPRSTPCTSRTRSRYRRAEALSRAGSTTRATDCASDSECAPPTGYSTVGALRQVRVMPETDAAVRSRLVLATVRRSLNSAPAGALAFGALGGQLNCDDCSGERLSHRLASRSRNDSLHPHRSIWCGMRRTPSPKRRSAGTLL